MRSQSSFVLIQQALARLELAKQHLARAKDGLTKADDFNGMAFHRAAALRGETQLLITAAQRLMRVPTVA
jgi:hypothetical protein